MKHRFTTLFISLLLAVCCLCPAPASAAPQPDTADLQALAETPAAPEVEAPSTILMEASTGSVLYAKDADRQLHPASITKILTALVVLEHCELDEIVTFSYRATHELEEGSSSIARTEGEQLSVEECLYAMLVASANEVAQALAEHAGGSIEGFADMMNAKAAELGCTGSHFVNPSGLNDEGHVTTSRDMALILRAAVQNPDFLRIASNPVHTVPATNKHSEPLTIAMKHKLLLKGEDHYDYAVCGKTGYTSIAGYTLATYAEKDGLGLVCVTMGCQSSDARYTSTRKLFDYGFENFRLVNIAENETVYRSADPGSGSAGFLSAQPISIRIPEESALVLPASVPFSALTGKFAWNASAGEGDAVATITYWLGDQRIGSADLIVTREENTLYDFLKTDTAVVAAPPEEEEAGEEGFFSFRNILIAVMIVLLLIVLILIIVRIDARRKQKRSYRRSVRARRSKRRRRRSRF